MNSIAKHDRDRILRHYVTQSTPQKDLGAGTLVVRFRGQARNEAK